MYIPDNTRILFIRHIGAIDVESKMTKPIPVFAFAFAAYFVAARRHVDKPSSLCSTVDLIPSAGRGTKPRLVRGETDAPVATGQAPERLKLR